MGKGLPDICQMAPFLRICVGQTRLHGNGLGFASVLMHCEVPPRAEGMRGSGLVVPASPCSAMLAGR